VLNFGNDPVSGLKRNASNPRSFKLVSGSTSRSLPASLHPTAMHQSKGIVISRLLIDKTIAGLLKDSKKIKGLKKKSGSTGLLLSNTANLTGSSTLSGKEFRE